MAKPTLDHFRQTISRVALVAAVAGLVGEPVAATAPADPAPWGRVLSQFERDGGLDYAGLQRSRGDLDTYLDSLAAARLDGVTTEQRAAFWSNAYNAVVAHFVLDHYPDLDSVKDVPGFFDRRRHPVAGEELTLDEIEDRALASGDPRVHFAVVCASAGCPELRSEPFAAERLDRQLEEQTQAFLADPGKGLRFDRDTGTLWLSSIFMWYADDFTGGSRVVAYFARGRVLDWVLDHLPPRQAAEIAEHEPRVRYLDYDWSLNDRPAPLARPEG